MARLAYDATKLAELNARSPGVVRSLKADIGTQVKKGQALITIDSPDIAADRSRLSAAASRVDIAEQNLKRTEQLVAGGDLFEKQLLEAKQELEQAQRADRALRRRSRRWARAVATRARTR